MARTSAPAVMPVELEAMGGDESLRFLETGEVYPIGATQARRVDVRVCLATHRDLRAMVHARQFREEVMALGLESVVHILLIGATTHMFEVLQRRRLAPRPRNVYPRVPDGEERAMTSDTRAQWRWLAGTYWYVLPMDLPALKFDPDDAKLTWLIDQTVWHISGYANGYFWGVAAVMMYDAGEPMPQRGPASRIAHLSLLGTVLPDGKTQITFIPHLRGTSGATTGFGQIVEIAGAWVVEMQMSTDRLGARVLHWANMVQTREGDPSWEQLPGLTHSVPEMLDGAVYPRLDAG